MVSVVFKTFIGDPYLFIFIPLSWAFQGSQVLKWAGLYRIIQ